MHLVQIEFDDNLLALRVTNRAFAFASVKVGENLVPRFFVTLGVTN